MPRPLTPLLALLAACWLTAPAFAQDEEEVPTPDETPAAETAPEGETPAGSPQDQKSTEGKEPATAPEGEGDDKPEPPKEDEAKPADEPEMKQDAAAEGDDQEVAEEPAEEEPAKKIEPETLVTNLESPAGLAISPKSGHVFVATRFGVYRYDPGAHKVYMDVVGYEEPVDTLSEGLEIGPLGLDFFGDSELIVGDGSRPAGEDVVRVYEIPDAPRGDEPANQKDAATQTFGPVGADVAGGEGAGNFAGIAVGDAHVYVSTANTTPKGWILDIPLADGKLGAVEPGIATADAAGTGTPGPLAWDAEENLVVGLMGEMEPGDGMLAVFDPDGGELLKKYDLGEISDPAGIAYSPKTDKLYVTDMSLHDPAAGGLYEVMLDGDEATVKRLLTLDKPAGVIFDADGKLYLTTWGTPDESKKAADGEPLSPGALHLIDAGL